MRGLRASLAALLLASPAAPGIGGCASSPGRDLKFIGASARWDDGLYVVTARIENGSPHPLFLDTIGVEMTTYDGAGRVIARAYPFSFRGQVEPFSTSRLPLHCPDRERRMRRSRLDLRDQRGRLISSLEVGEPEPLEPAFSSSRDADSPPSP
jgi:hypothetical protein